MKVHVLYPQLVYNQKDVDELESASIFVRRIYEKAFTILGQYISRSSIGQKKECFFLKWLHSPSGWKCIGFENFSSDCIPAKAPAQFYGMILNIMIWSQYEQIKLLYPLLGEECFYSGEELEVIAKYFVPTYMSSAPLEALGKPVIKQKLSIPVFQERIEAPHVTITRDGELLKGKWVTGVTIDGTHLIGIEPYLKDGEGLRTYLPATIEP